MRIRAPLHPLGETLMIICGSTGKEKTIARLDFYCPRCREESSCEHVRVSRYFTLYFIPLFAMDTLGEYIRCEQCAGEFNTDVLDLRAEDVEAALAPWKCAHCGNRNPAGQDTCLNCQEVRVEDDIFME
jgi:Zn finger protein HypA/HybF involved in hydrogenase expression